MQRRAANRELARRVIGAYDPSIDYRAIRESF